MKRGLNIQINFTNRFIYTFVAFILILIIGVAVYAFGTSTPSTLGHSAGELDLSSGVNGDALFNNNVRILGQLTIGTGTIKITDNGIIFPEDTITSCTITNKGTLRFNGVEFQSCDGGNWKALGATTITGGTGGIYTGPLVSGSLTGTDCSNAGGIPTDIGNTNFVCKFTGNSCASGWIQYQEWTTTQTQTCTGTTGGNNCAGSSCTLNGHVFLNQAPTTCTYKNGQFFDTEEGGRCGTTFSSRTCTENAIEIGCVGP